MQQYIQKESLLGSGVSTDKSTNFDQSDYQDPLSYDRFSKPQSDYQKLDNFFIVDDQDFADQQTEYNYHCLIDVDYGIKNNNSEFPYNSYEKNQNNDEVWNPYQSQVKNNDIDPNNNQNVSNPSDENEFQISLQYIQAQTNPVESYKIPIKKKFGKQKRLNGLGKVSCQETNNLFILIGPFIIKLLKKRLKIWPVIDCLHQSHNKMKSLSFFNQLLKEIEDKNDLNLLQSFRKVINDILEYDYMKYSQNQTQTNQYVNLKYKEAIKLIMNNKSGTFNSNKQPKNQLLNLLNQMKK